MKERMPKPDYMSEQEYQDLETMKDEVIETKVRAFDYMVSLSRMTPEHLKQTGHSSIGSALEWTVKRYNTDVEKLHKAYIKKYPD